MSCCPLGVNAAELTHVEWAPKVIFFAMLVVASAYCVTAPLKIRLGKPTGWLFGIGDKSAASQSLMGFHRSPLIHGIEGLLGAGSMMLCKALVDTVYVLTICPSEIATYFPVRLKATLDTL